MIRWHAIGRRTLNVGLIALIGTGGALTWRSGQERNRLWNDYQRLYRVAGDLPVADPTRVYFKALETTEPLHYAWRAYLPPNYKLELRHKHGGASSGSTSSSREFIGRVRLRESKDGLLECYTHFYGSSSRMGLGDQSLATFVRTHATELQVEQLGKTESASLAPDQPAALLRVSVPDSLRAEARKELSAHAQLLLPTIFELEIGPKPAKP